MRWKWVLALSLLLTVPQAVNAQGGTITGLVTGSGERPLAGAAVTVQGTSLAVRTAANGRYTISNVPAGARTVRASFAGHAEGTRQVTVAAAQTATVNITLSPQAVQLEGLVAIGYGTAARRDVTGSIASVRAEEAITRAAPTAAVATALQGRATGVQVVSNSGAPGAGVSVRVRGSNSISANSEPLYVIDGLPVAQGSAGTGNPLASIDTNEIESIEVLKDASSTSIYGARGANGVVLITTKRGARGSNRVSIESSYGIQEIARNIPVMNSPQHMQFINETRVNRGLAARYSQIDMDTAKTYDYVAAITRRAPQMAHSLSFSGGDENTRYLLGGNFSEQEGIILGTDFKRYGLRFNLDRTISDRFRIGNSLSLTNVYVQDAGSGNQFATATQYLPWVPFRDAEGNWVRDLGFVGIQGIGSNPLATVTEQTNDNFAWRGIGTIFGEFDVTDALKFRSQVGGNFSFAREGIYSPSTITQGFAVGGQANLNTNQARELTSENLVTWRREIGPGAFDVLGGFSVQTSDFQSQSAGGQTIPSDVLDYNALGQSASTGRVVGSNRVEWTLLSYLGRANYNLLDRYIFTVTGRRDGSSRFGANNKWAFFPSAAFAWRAIDEGFMQRQNALSDLKFRLSYGRTGNQAISEYQSLPQLQTQFYGFGTSSVERIAISPAAQSGNPDLKWETQDQLNVGFDLGVLNNRVSLSADAYQSQTSDLLLSVELPWTTGTSSQLRNVGAVRNRGVELALNAIVWEGDRFNWRTTLNFAKNTNEVLKLAEGQEFFLPLGSGAQGLGGNTHIVQVGKPLGSIFGFRTDGLFQKGDPCPFTARPALCAPGEIKAFDLNGDGNLTLLDREIVGNGDPNIYGGLNNSLSFGPVSLDAFFNYAFGNEIANLPKVYSGLSRGIVNEYAYVNDRWTPTNTDSKIPRANNARDGFLYDIIVEDGSFVRLQTLTLGYTLPTGLLPGGADARLNLTGQNLWLWTNYTGFDPEVSARGGDSRNRGVDHTPYPRARTYNIGLNVNF